jgi:hypothetical protein
MTFIFKIIYRIFGIIYSKLDWPSATVFKRIEKMYFLSNVYSELSSNPIQLDHWRDITNEILIQISDDDRNFFRNKWVRDALHPDQYYYANKYLFILKTRYSLETIKSVTAELPYGNPLQQVFFRTASPASIKHFYLIDKLIKNFHISISTIDYVFEFGGGYGSMARIFLKLRNPISYTIFDLPIMKHLQQLYLSSCYSNLPNCIKLTSNINEIPDLYSKASVFIATWSLSETPIELRKEIAKKLINFEYIFIAFQEHYNNISNIEYFSTLATNMIEYNCTLEKCNIYSGHFYLSLSKKVKDATLYV